MRRSLPQPCGWRADPQVFGRPPPGCVLHFSRTFGMRSRRSLDDLVLRTGRRRHVGRDKARLRRRRHRRGRPARIALIAAAGAASAGAVAAALAADDAGSAASGAHARADGSASAAGPTLEDGSGTARCAGIAPGSTPAGRFSSCKDDNPPGTTTAGRRRAAQPSRGRQLRRARKGTAFSCCLSLNTHEARAVVAHRPRDSERNGRFARSSVAQRRSRAGARIPRRPVQRPLPPAPLRRKLSRKFLCLRLQVPRSRPRPNGTRRLDRA